MRRFAQLIILVPIAFVLVVFAVANRGAVTLSLDPFQPDAPALSVTLPLFALIFATLLIGILIGGAAAWFRQSKWRQAARARKREAEHLRADAAAAPPPHRPAPAGPGLPSPTAGAGTP